MPEPDRTFRATQGLILAAEPTQVRRTNPQKKGQENPSSVIEGSYTVNDDGGPISVDEALQWTKAQIGYENLATQRDVAERTLKYVTSIRTKFQSKALALHHRWRMNNHVLRGNTLGGYGLQGMHVPEPSIAMENLVPRVEEAVLDFDPWFHVHGRDEMDRADANAIQAFLMWQLDQLNAEGLYQPFIRSMFTYQVGITKLWWKRELRERVESRSERTVDENGKAKWTINRKRGEEVVYDGPAARLIDPYDFIVDTKALDVQSGMYVGDSTMMEQEDLFALERLGLFVNTKQLMDRQPVVRDGSGNLQENHKWARSVTEQYDQGSPEPDGTAKRFKVTELWGRFDLYGTGRPVESVLTVVDDAVVVRAQENPFDNKMRPDAVARSAKEGWDFFNVGPFDQATVLSHELDHHRSLILEAHKLSVCPIGFAEGDATLPDSLFGIRPGKIFTGTGKVQFTSPPDTLQSAAWVEGTLRQDIQRVTGAPELFEGSGGSNTATESERKVAEGNRRVKVYVRQISRGLIDMLQIMHGMNRQFIAAPVAYRVLGKQAENLGPYREITPDTLLNDVDFELVGLHNLHNLGSRTTGLLNYLNITRDYAQMYPDLVNIPRLLQNVYEQSVGRQLGEDVVTVPTPPSQLVPYDIENNILLQGQTIAVDDLDDHQEHIQGHMPLLEHDDPQVVQAAGEHLLEHTLKAEAQIKAQNQQRTPTAPMPMGMQGGQEQGPNSSFQEAQENPAQTAPFETPGPANPERMTPGGRSIAQQGNTY